MPPGFEPWVVAPTPGELPLHHKGVGSSDIGCHGILVVYPLQLKKANIVWIELSWTKDTTITYLSQAYLGYHHVAYLDHYPASTRK